MSRRGFSLLEMALALGISGVLMGGVWQLTSVAGKQTESARVAAHALTVARAASDYLAANKTAILAQLPNFTSSVRIKINSADTGNASLTDLVTAGSLNSTFTNLNSYSQTYALYVARQDAGTAGVDASDRLIGLLLTTGGQTISDQLGSVVAPRLGAGGGFMFATDNPVSPATTIRGTAGGWAVNLSAAPWTGIGAVATSGHLAVLTNMMASGTSSGGGGGGASNIDALTDGKTDYTTSYNLFMGDTAGDAITSGAYNTAIGIGALKANTTGTSNLGLGYNALVANTTGSNNLVVGDRGLMTNTTGSRNIAIGTYRNIGGGVGASLQKNTTGNRNVAIGSGNLGRNTTGEGNIAIGEGGDWSGALVNNTTGSENVAIGTNTLTAGTTASSNVAIGYGACANCATSHNIAIGDRVLLQGSGGANVGLGTTALYALTSGHHNVAIGSGDNWDGALKAITTGSYNTAIGFAAGTNLTTETYNIVIGAGVSAPATGRNSLINIGNLIYGDITNGRLGIASASSINTAGISFDAGYVSTDSSRLAKGTTAQRPTCTASLEGAQRWNTQTQNMEVCTGGVWVQPTPAWTSVSGTPPTPSSGSGYFVITSTPTTGNLGGIAGANAWCLTDLTNNDWKNKATAVANGQLTAAKVKAFVCLPSTMCNELMPLTTYYFARSGDNTVGGASMTMDSSGRGPNNSYSWSAANYFSGTFDFWTQRYSSSSVSWEGSNSMGGCSTWTSDSSSVAATYGTSGDTGRARWGGGGNYRACNESLYLICFVNP